jgi:hypothetical protein
MSFAPPSSDRPSPSMGPPGQRSTPIPGFDSPLPGPAAHVPGPAEFLSNPSTSPFAFQSNDDAGPPPIKTGRSFGSIMIAMILIAGPVAGVGVAVWAFMRARDTADRADQAIDQASQTVDSLLQQAQDDLDGVSIPVVIPDLPGASVPDQPTQTVPTQTVPTPTVPAPVSLFTDDAAPAVVAAFDAGLSGEPTRFMQVLLYPDYAFATVQDATIPTHVDEFPWRDGAIGESRPITLVGDGDLEASLWNAADVDWTFIARAVAEAPALTTVEEGAVSHIIIERSVFTADFALVVHVYVTGPRGGAYVEYTPAGALVRVVQ